ncbi:hypothetical protein [Thalassospira alkalitolerans]|uniref:hypothetical protein n=1 Tax=Thalassospira alkalitolerans TaxID=1293890 RepID=UPI003AA80511
MKSRINVLYLTSVYFVPLIYFCFAILFSPETALLEPDSSGYIHFSPSRTAGYPVLLSSVALVTGDVSNVVFFQIILFCVCVSFLLKRCWSFEFGWLMVSAVSVVSFFNPFFLKYHYSVLTESVFFSLIAIILTCFIDLFRSPKNRKSWIVLGGCIGCAVLVRPVGISFIPLIPIIFLLIYFEKRPGNWKMMVSSIVVFCSFILIGQVVKYSFHGDNKESLFPLVVFAKSALVEAGPAPYLTNDPRYVVWSDLENDTEQVREILKQAKDVNFAVEQYLRQNYEVFFQFQYEIDTEKFSKEKNYISIDDLKVDVGMHRLMRSFPQYLGLIAKNYLDLWGIGAAMIPAFVDDGNYFIERNAPLPFNENGGVVSEEMSARAIGIFIYPLMMAAWVLSIIIIILGVFFRRNYAHFGKSFNISLICSLMVNGNFLFISIIGVGVARYSLEMMIPISLMVSSFILCLFKVCSRINKVTDV